MNGQDLDAVYYHRRTNGRRVGLFFIIYRRLEWFYSLALFSYFLTTSVVYTVLRIQWNSEVNKCLYKLSLWSPRVAYYPFHTHVVPCLQHNIIYYRPVYTFNSHVSYLIWFYVEIRNHSQTVGLYITFVQRHNLQQYTIPWRVKNYEIQFLNFFYSNWNRHAQRKFWTFI